MSLTKTCIALFAFVLASFCVGTAQAGSLLSAFGQTLCVSGGGDGTSWDWELRPAGGGTPFCSGTESSTGSQDQLVTLIVTTIDFCTFGVSAYFGSTLGTSCPAGMTAFTIARSPDTLNFELAFEDATNPPNLVVATAGNPVNFNPTCQPTPGTNTPIACNGVNPCCDGGSPPCRPVPEPSVMAGLMSGTFLLVGLARRRRR